MRFTSPALVESVVWDLRLADQPRGINRALVARLFNGLPPYTEEDAKQNRIDTNVNFLEGARIASDARRCYYNAFLKPGNYFNISLDYGPAFKRKAWSNIITRELRKMMKGSRRYFEFLRSQFALAVLHGIGPGFWVDREHWCPRCLGVEDVLIPSNTLLTMENLSHFAIYRRYTAMELYQMTHRPKVDPGWNMPLVNSALKWVYEQTQAQLAYADLYAPEKIEDRWKQDLGFYATDAVPTIDCWDFYFYSDEQGQEGWRRRIIMDTPSDSEVATSRRIPPRNLIGESKSGFLFNPGDNRIYGSKLDEIIHFQFADATATAPFRYHSVRSLGWLLYAVCHLQNRLRSQFCTAIFESLMQYFRTSNPADKERIMSIDLHHTGVIPEGLAFVKPEERWKIDQNLVEMGFVQNQQMMTDSAAQYREGRNQTLGGKEKTATEIMAEVNSQNAMVGAMLIQAYEYQKFQGMEISRRACIKNSADPEIQKFRVNCLKSGVPEEAMDSSMWDVEPERVLGNGNKVLEIAMADKLMAAKNLHDPESQREILYLYDMANSDNPDLAERLVPLDKGRISESVHDAELMIGSLMLGVNMEPVKGQNPIEIIESLFRGMAATIMPIREGFIPLTAERLVGLRNIAGTIDKYIGMLAEDKQEKERVKQYKDESSKIMTIVEELEKRFQDQSSAPGGNGAPQLDPQDVAKAQATMMLAKTKAKATAKSHAQRTQQRDVQFRMGLIQDAEKHQAELKKKLAETKLAAAATDIKTAAEIKKNRLRALQG